MRETPRSAEAIGQVIYALERAEQSLLQMRDVCLSKRDYSAEFYDSDASAMRDAVNLIRALSAAEQRAEAMERDAARYRWLADKVIAPDYGDNDSVPHQMGYLIKHCKGPSVIYGDSLNAAIDADLASSAGNSTEHGR